MASLKHHHRQQPIGAIELSEGVYLAGRNDDCDIVLLSPQCSRSHLRLTFDGSGSLLLEDLQSANGTFINGVREYRRQLTHHCIIQLGDDMLVFEPEDEASVATKLPFWARRPQERDSRDSQDAEGATSHIPPAVQRRSHADLRVQAGPHLVFSSGASTRTHPLDGDVTTIGHGAVTVSLDRSATGSKRVLAEVIRKGTTEYLVRAVGAFRRIRVNGKSCASARLESGDTIVVGGETIRFHLGLLDEEETSG